MLHPVLIDELIFTNLMQRPPLCLIIYVVNNVDVSLLILQKPVFQGACRLAPACVVAFHHPYNIYLLLGCFLSDLMRVVNSVRGAHVRSVLAVSLMIY
jgi:hypothetical protein